MDKSLWESLLDDINKLKEKGPPSADDAPKIQSLLRQVNELTGAGGTVAPAAAKPIDDALAGSSGSRALTGGQGGDGKGTASDFSAPEEGGWRDSAERARTAGQFTVNLPNLREGVVFRQKPESADRVDLTPDKAVAMLRRILGKEKAAWTDEDFTNAESIAGWIEGIPQNTEAYGKLPPELKLFGKTATRSMKGKFSAPMPTAGDWNATSVERSNWNKWAREAVTSGIDSIFSVVAGRAFTKGAADTLANLADGANFFIGSEDFQKTTEQYRELVESHLGRLDEFKDLKSLDRAEMVGNLVAEWALGGAAGKLVEGAGWVGKLASGKLAEALQKLSPEQLKATLKATEGIIGKLKQTSFVEKLGQSPVIEKLAGAARKVGETGVDLARKAWDKVPGPAPDAIEAARKAKVLAGKAAEMAPGAAEMAANEMIVGGETYHNLKEAGHSEREAGWGGYVAGQANGLATVVAHETTDRFLPKVLRDTPVSDFAAWVLSGVLGAQASKGVEGVVEGVSRRQREQAGSRLPPVEELRRLLIDG